MSITEAEVADRDLRALLHRLKDAHGLTYELLAERAGMARGSVGNYLSKARHRRDTTRLLTLLDVLGASEQDRALALKLHQRTTPGAKAVDEKGWAERARDAKCTVWTMAEFTASEATVHTAIGRRHAARPSYGGSSAPPAYVLRTHDEALRRDVAAAKAGMLRRLIVLRGMSSTGKTRSLFEAVHALCSDWTVIRPHSAVAPRKLPDHRLFDRRPVVVWLNELQGFLGPNGAGLSIDVLRDLYGLATAPVVMVGTLWPDKLLAASDPQDESRSNTRELLATDTPWVHWHDLPRTLSTTIERATAQRLAERDPRLAAAVADTDRFGFAQTLAGAHEQLERYRNAPTETARLLLDAAADARRLGHSGPLTAPLLRALTLALWWNEHGPAAPPAASWFDDALEYASQPLRSANGVRALIPIDDTVVLDHAETQPIGYGLADYLEQHLTRTRRSRPVLDNMWQTLETYVSRREDLDALAHAAGNRGRFGHAEALYQLATATGDQVALHRLASWLDKRLGREADTEAVLRRATTAGDPEAVNRLASWLKERPGREDDIEKVYRAAIATGNQTMQISLARLLAGQPGREADTEQAFREAAAAGGLRAQSARHEFAEWLTKRPGREAEAEALRLYRDPALESMKVSCGNLFDAQVNVGTQHPLEEDPAEELRQLAEWSKGRPEREADAEIFLQHWRQYPRPADVGSPSTMESFAWWLTTRPGRDADAEVILRQVAADGKSHVLVSLGWWLATRGREADAEATWSEAVAGDDALQLHRFISVLWMPVRSRKAETILEQAAEIISANLFLDAPGEATRQWGTVSELQIKMREATAESVFREAAAAGVPRALPLLAWWLTKLGREAEAEVVYRESAVVGDRDALSELVQFLSGWPGRQAEVDLILRFGLDAYGRTSSTESVRAIPLAKPAAPPAASTAMAAPIARRPV